MTEEKREVIDLKTLAGEHFLTGVDLDTERRKVYEWRDEEPCEVIRFILDGVTYEAIEDPSDGYRSSHEGPFKVETPVRNMFAPVRVVGRYREKGEYSGTDDVLELLDAANGKVILEVGTTNVDDYYPGFAAHWRPEDMACNALPASVDQVKP